MKIQELLAGEPAALSIAGKAVTLGMSGSEVASYVVFDDKPDPIEVWVAAANGLLIVKPKRHFTSQSSLEYWPWMSVHGARWFAAGFVEMPWTITGRIDEPAFDVSTDLTGRATALVDFIAAAAERQAQT